MRPLAAPRKVCGHVRDPDGGHDRRSTPTLDADAHALLVVEPSVIQWSTLGFGRKWSECCIQQASEPKRGVRMNATSEALQSQMHQRLARLQTLRDEIRVRIHLAAAEVKDAWDNLEPQIAGAEMLASYEASPAARTLLDRVLMKTTTVHERLLAKAS